MGQRPARHRQPTAWNRNGCDFFLSAGIQSGQSNIDAAKRAARREARSRRGQATSPGEAGAKLAANLCGAGIIADKAVVSAFWPLEGEIDTRPAMEALHRGGCAVVLPVVRGKNLPLSFRLWRPGDDLVPAAFGTREPRAEMPELEPDVLLVPLLAFDRAGFRLGYGGGFYDRTLLRLRRGGSVFAIGVAFAVQEVPLVPRGPHDQPLDWIVTEAETIRIRAA